MKTFLFYDIETSGLNPAFDQILTFACIRTDLSLGEISRELIVIKLRQDIIPSPQAFITHCLTQDDLKKGITEYQAALKIHALVNTPGTLSLGYNSLGFDDDFLRFLFYRNLLDPYSHQYASQCGRMDLLPITTLYKIFSPQVLSWPKLGNGLSSLKLELISRENGFLTSGRAHEAVADVEAVIELARVFSRQESVWDYALNFFDKTRDSFRINALEPQCQIGNGFFRLCLMVSASFGPKNNYLAPVICMGDSIPYKNQSLWVRMDLEEGFQKIQDPGHVFVIRKRPGDQWIVLPFLERFQTRLTPDSWQKYTQNMEETQADPDGFLKLIQFHLAYEYPPIPDLDPDAALYQEGFFSSSEKKEITRFHNAKLLEKAIVCDSFQSDRVRILARRILSRNFEALFLVHSNPEYADHMKRLRSSFDQGKNPDQSVNPIKGYKNDYKYDLALGMQHLKEIQNQEKTLSTLQKEVLAWLKTYMEKLAL